MAFIIKNTTDRDVVLDDLRVILGANKQIDLDRIAPRHLIDSSPKLRLAFQQKRVVTVSQDGIGIIEPVINDNSELKLMEARLRAEFRKQIKELQQQQPPASTQPDSTSKIDELNSTIQLLMKQLATQQVQPVVPDSVVKQNSEQAAAASTADGLSDDIATRMHAKTMQRLGKKVTGGSDVTHESKTIKDNSLSNNIDELEGLL